MTVILMLTEVVVMVTAVAVMDVVVDVVMKVVGGDHDGVGEVVGGA